MRRNATKVAAAVLTLAVTMTSVNIPTTAAAATKKVKLNTTKKTLTVGKTLKLTLKEGKKKVKATKVKFTSSKKAIATVTKYGNVKAKKKGTATITATYKKKKYKCKITVKKKATPAKPTTAPTQAPTQEPTTAPTQEPTTVPTQEPTTAPTDTPATVGTITGFKAIGAKKLQVEFGSAVADKATRDSLSIKRGNATVAGKATWDAENKVATFTSDGILTQGKYTVSMNGVDSKEVDVEAEKVADIVINGDKDTVLTGTSNASKQLGRSNDEAYIYYDIVNQYGESIRERTTVNWSITSCDTNRENKSLGLVVAHRRDDKEIFIYGTQLSITAVCIKDNVPVTKTKVVTIGEQQAIDEVVYKGFVKKSQKGKKIDDKDVKTDVPADFAKNTWALLYQAKDQHGNLLEATSDNLGTGSAGAKIAMISGQPTYIENKFEDDGIYSVTSAEGNRTIEYSSATIEPGAYIDRGESIDITAISTRTGKKTDGKFGIGKTKRLKSFQIETPSKVVADGDRDVEIPYTAIDMEGNPTNNYKTIVRSSNKINLTASEGTLKLYEENDGTATLRWTDDGRYLSGDSVFGTNTKYIDGNIPYNPYANSAISTNDGVDRAISLTAVVTGEESSSKTTTLVVSDMRRPASIEDVHFGRNDNDTVIGGNGSEFQYVYTGNGRSKYKEVRNASGVITGFEEAKDKDGKYTGDYKLVNQDIHTDVSIIDDIDYNDQYGMPLNRDQKYYFWHAARENSIKGYDYSIGVRQLSGKDNILMLGFDNSNSNTTNVSSDNDGENNYFITGSNTNVTGATNSDIIDLEKAFVSSKSNNWNDCYYDTQKDDLIIRHDISPRNWKKSVDESTKERFNEEVNATIRYSIVERPQTSSSSYNDIGKVRTESYTIVPINKVTDFTIDTAKNKFGIITEVSEDPNGSFADGNGSYNYLAGKNANDFVTGSALKIKTRKYIPYSDDIEINRIFVKSKYKNLTLDVPFNYIRTTDEYNWNNSIKPVSGSGILISRNNKLDDTNVITPKSDYRAYIDKINDGAIKWKDLYDVNTARYLRKDTTAKLELIIGTDVNNTDNSYNDNGKLITKKDTHDGIIVNKYITISDAPVLPDEMKFEPKYTVHSADTVIEKNDFWDWTWNNVNPIPIVADQYGQLYEERKILYTISGYKENTNGRIEDNSQIENKSNGSSVVRGAECGDSYTLKAELENTSWSATTQIEVGSDNNAYISSDASDKDTKDYNLRTKYLGYNR